mmetsp:Transcript_35374/g.94197  ORF Transcript_35374/g.94197 Transcript_35374/m.94197 type:complete len:134 (+) Transcript_35374:775-1176(+)
MEDNRLTKCPKDEPASRDDAVVPREPIDAMDALEYSKVPLDVFLASAPERFVLLLVLNVGGMVTCAGGGSGAAGNTALDAVELRTLIAERACPSPGGDDLSSRRGRRSPAGESRGERTRSVWRGLLPLAERGG